MSIAAKRIRRQAPQTTMPQFKDYPDALIADAPHLRNSVTTNQSMGPFSGLCAEIAVIKLQKRFKGSLPIEGDDWQIGVIVGRSGSGKSSIAKRLFPEAYIAGFEYPHKCILDDFPEALETGEITKNALQRRLRQPT